MFPTSSSDNGSGSTKAVRLQSFSVKAHYYCSPENAAAVVDGAGRSRGTNIIAHALMLSVNVEDRGGDCFRFRFAPLDATAATATGADVALRRRGTIALILSVEVGGGGCFRCRCPPFNAGAAAATCAAATAAVANAAVNAVPNAVPNAVAAVARVRTRGSRRCCWAVAAVVPVVVAVAVPLAERLPPLTRPGAIDQRLPLVVVQVASVHSLFPTLLVVLLLLPLLLLLLHLRLNRTFPLLLLLLPV